jgi:hypothetical protein
MRSGCYYLSAKEIPWNSYLLKCKITPKFFFWKLRDECNLTRDCVAFVQEGKKK